MKKWRFRATKSKARVRPTDWWNQSVTINTFDKHCYTQATVIPNPAALIWAENNNIEREPGKVISQPPNEASCRIHAATSNCFHTPADAGREHQSAFDPMDAPTNASRLKQTETFGNDASRRWSGDDNRSFEKFPLETFPSILQPRCSRDSHGGDNRRLSGEYDASAMDSLWQLSERSMTGAPLSSRYLCTADDNSNCLFYPLQFPDNNSAFICRNGSARECPDNKTTCIENACADSDPRTTCSMVAPALPLEDYFQGLDLVENSAVSSNCFDHFENKACVEPKQETNSSLVKNSGLGDGSFWAVAPADHLQYHDSALNKTRAEEFGCKMMEERLNNHAASDPCQSREQRMTAKSEIRQAPTYCGSFCLSARGACFKEKSPEQSVSSEADDSVVANVQNDQSRIEMERFPHGGASSGGGLRALWPGLLQTLIECSALQQLR